ncbi:MAG: hypothetical protein KAS62_06375, partial [Candidatus Delongbacteria bacterium]|nr:hypothetical protein [Candidatus Delongbacteria bacterium]
MKRIFLLFLILIMSISLFSQETEILTEETIQPDTLLVDTVSVVEEIAVVTEQDKLCKEAAED